ncbi:MAG: cytochrome c [Salinisphaera sp.]
MISLVAGAVIGAASITGVSAMGMMHQGMMRSSGGSSDTSAGTRSGDRAGARLVQQFCTGCHTSPSPVQHAPEQWPAVVARMKRYMYSRGIKAPDRAQTRAIEAYLAQSAHSR